MVFPLRCRRREIWVRRVCYANGSFLPCDGLNSVLGLFVETILPKRAERIAQPTRNGIDPTGLDAASGSWRGPVLDSVDLAEWASALRWLRARSREGHIMSAKCRRESLAVVACGRLAGRHGDAVAGATDRQPNRLSRRGTCRIRKTVTRRLWRIASVRHKASGRDKPSW